MARGRRLSEPRLLGGFAFRSDFTPDNTWSIYSPAFFALPHYQLVTAGDDAWLTINTQIPPDESPARLIPDLRAALRRKNRAAAGWRAGGESVAGGSALIDIDYPMRYPSLGEDESREATARIRAGALRKVVLARAAELRFDESGLQLLPILRHLAAHYANCCRFLV